MKTSIFLTSFFSMKSRGSNPRTSAAICAAYPVTSNLVTRSTPLVPISERLPVGLGANAQRRHQTDARDDDPPGQSPSATSWSLGVRLDVVDRFLDAGDLLGVLVRDLDPELLLERHHELHGIERVGPEVVDERRIRRHFFLVHAKLLDDDALHLV